MWQDRPYENEAEEANWEISEKFKDYSARSSANVNSEADMANQQIQEQFYGEEKEINSLPFHVDVNNPPIKK
ncbi:hypothetical protein BIV60_03590 [Bacillus sp. MUM 116]|uniref:hypothetical protein n=1 Tax=Bacillus sp. MUM 116 TaxID=1678002 RepID=UPI0008F58505|nr:hypothetical protein [Bacillus sp. MUM 116]OIK16566.1 hypothetical protein BIV60_03590 [Bacillus sp. MUM 116]